eukprot:g4641.t1
MTLTLLKRRLFSTGPFSGVRVLDLTRILAGPMCAQALGDYGADVWKIERPGRGDDTRTWGPPFASDGNSTYNIGANRNKRSIAVDVKSAEGVELIKSLASNADVLLENFITGKMEELGLGYDVLSEINPRLIYCSISGYGQSGPKANFPGYDVIISATGGLMGITGTELEPCKTGVALIDQVTGLHCQAAVGAALFSREKTGKGQKIDVSLLDSCVHSLANIASGHLNATDATRVPQKRYGTAHESIVPYQAFSSKDGTIVLGTGNDVQWRKLCDAIGGEDGRELAEEKKFATNADRVTNRSELLQKLNFIFSTKPTEHWKDKLEGLIPFGPLNSIADVFEDAQVIHGKVVEQYENTKLKGVRNPVLFSDTPTSIRMGPPSLGEHTVEVLKEVLNLNDFEIEELKKTGTIQ